MSLKIYNTMSGMKEVFIPLRNGEVSMYVCGPTVYDMCHIGHARSAVVFDMIRRYMEYKGYKVKYARNYTDIDDKIIERASRENLSFKAIADKFIKEYELDMKTLGTGRPDLLPKATETISEIIELIEILIDEGYAYTVRRGENISDVFYRVRRFSCYGKLSGKDIEELESGARIDINPDKEDPLDFCLWKSSRAGEPSWISPWGDGRPGWHIECSAMSRKLFGDTLDIHGGGRDLVFPHHENEIAQSEAATGSQYVRYWLHNGFVNLNREKMSKSIGNFIVVRDVLNNYHPDVLRLFFLSSHYRSPIEYSPEYLREMEASLERLCHMLVRIENQPVSGQTVAKRVDYLKLVEELDSKASMFFVDFDKAMDDDFNTAKVIGLIFDLVKKGNTLMDLSGRLRSNACHTALLTVKKNIIKAGKILGLFNDTHTEFLEKRKNLFLKAIKMSKAEIQDLIGQRRIARELKDYKLADEIRNQLNIRGIILEDTIDGVVWRIRG